MRFSTNQMFRWFTWVCLFLGGFSCGVAFMRERAETMVKAVEQKNLELVYYYQHVHEAIINEGP